VDQLHSLIPELCAREPLGLRGRSPRLERVRLLDERAHHEALTPLRDLLANALVGARPSALRADDVRLDGAPACRELAQQRGVEVAVSGERERARDRRCGHVEGVRDERARSLGVECAPLAYPEAVLLIDHTEGELAELDRLLD
jgi:hypothetical protein